MRSAGRNSIKARMVWSYLLLIFLVVCVLGIVFGTLIWNYYYGSAQSSVKQRALTALELHGRSLASLNPPDQGQYMLQNMIEGGTRLQLLDPSGNLRIDSDGFADKLRYATPDVKLAEAGSSGSWIGVDPYYGERVVSVTVPVWNGLRIVSLLRYSAGLTQVDDMVLQLIRMTCIVGIAVVLLFLGLSLLLAQRIVRPIRELTRAARHMADGDWTRRAQVHGHDEIGLLAETFNSMAIELQQREKLKDDFISSISHELRTPLTSIKGWSETLKDGEPGDEEEMQLGLSIISRETERLSGLVEDLLDFSKLSARNMELHTETLDLNSPVRETVRQLAVREEQTGVRIVSSLGKSAIIVSADANRIKQVVINLIDNAFKYTPSGGSIHISTYVADQSVILTVADTGSGIAEEDLPHVTEKFYKASKGHGGSGLGLAICREIIELHGGSLSMDSELGAGTIVTVKLPVLTE